MPRTRSLLVGPAGSALLFLALSGSAHADPLFGTKTDFGTGASSGGTLATGVYFYRLETPDGASLGRFVVAK
jgi:hypothetical protein